MGERSRRRERRGPATVTGRVRKRQLLAALPALAALIVSGCGSSSSAGGTHRSSTTTTTRASTATVTPAAHASIGPEGIPLEQGPPLAPASSTTPGTPVDGIHCAPVEQLAYHIHAHLQVYVNGQPRSLPGAIGMVGPVGEQTPYGVFYGATGCYYWLHTHASDGVIHIESPSQRIYTLGQFFDEWRQPLSSHQVAGATGSVTAIVNGQRWPENPRNIPLLPHDVIQLDVGSPVTAFGWISWAGTTL